MTDNEIIKALECCNKPLGENSCTECAFYHSGRCSHNMLKAALDLINRQKAENKRLQKNIDGLNIFTTNHIKVIRIQAIKEFAERLKEKLNNLEYHENSDRKTFTKAKLYHVVNWIMHEVVPDEIDNLVTEMTEVEIN